MVSLAEDSDTGIGVCGWILTIICWLLVLVTMPFSFFIFIMTSNLANDEIAEHALQLRREAQLLAKQRAGETDPKLEQPGTLALNYIEYSSS